MKFIADFHIHSHYSISTSKQLTPEHLEAWARIKGITVVGTGDFTHPCWLAELKEKLEPAEEGLLRLKNTLRLDPSAAGLPPESGGGSAQVRFLLTAEISNVYRKGGRVRKVHNLIFVPDFAAAEALQRRLGRVANLSSDGRPVLGLDSRDLLEIALDASGATFFVPAHIWTPWFSVLGAKSGFDGIAECYGDLAVHILAVETGLSSDPPLNWLCSFLDAYALISNSDAHSPEKLGREANLFDTELSYSAITAALKAAPARLGGGAAAGAANSGGAQTAASARSGPGGPATTTAPAHPSAGPEGFLGTTEFFPQEGKYHYDGHRRCGVCWDPLETLQHGGICPACGRQVTVGVLSRVAQLADRDEVPDRAGRAPFRSLIPLKEILAELSGLGSQAGEVTRLYGSLIRKAGSELSLLLELSVEEVARIGGEPLGEAVRRMRCGEVHIEPGYDGEYGRITLFRKGESRTFGPQELLFEQRSPQKPAPSANRSAALIGFDLNRYRNLHTVMLQAGQSVPSPEAERSLAAGQEIGERSEVRQPALFSGAAALAEELNREQRQAVEHFRGPALILAGPGTGKTRTLTTRIAHLIQERSVPPEKILAVTFTNKAAEQMTSRLRALLPDREALGKLRISTFHAFGLSILREQCLRLGRTYPFTVLDEEDRKQLVAGLLGVPRGRAAATAEAISAAKQSLSPPEELPDPETVAVFKRYEELLIELNAVDLDDLIRLPVQLFQINTQVLASYRDMYPWLLIDEYQDLNAAQYRLVRLLMSDPQSNLFVIGDPNQAIYGFRGADVRFISSFLEDYPGAAVYRFRMSYRCSATILQASGQVLARPETQVPLEGLQPGVRIRITESSSDRSEAEFVARSIEELIGGLRFFSLDSRISRGEEAAEIRSLSDFAVLCRIGRQMEPLEKAFRDHSIPYQKVGDSPWFKQEPAKSVLEVLRALQSPGNRWLRERLALRKTASEAALEQWRQLLDSKTSLSRVIEEIGETLAGRDPDDREVLKQLAALAADLEGNPDRLVELALLGSEIDTYRPNTEAVALMTLHAAKGLEFPCVFIVGCEEGLLPYSFLEGHSPDPEEERRLFYVGMTRARTFLFLSHSRKRILFGREYRPARSPFLTAIEEELTERAKAEPKKPARAAEDQLNLF